MTTSSWPETSTAMILLWKCVTTCNIYSPFMSQAPYKYSLAHEVNSPPRHRRPRRSASPEQREYNVQGGGRSSSRNRAHSGQYRGDRERDNGYAGRDRGKARDDGGGGYPSRERDNGYDRRNAVKRERGDDGYDEQERQRERDGDRKRYEEGVSLVAGPVGAPG